MIKQPFKRRSSTGSLRGEWIFFPTRGVTLTRNMRESYENRRRLWTRVARPSEARPRYNEERKRKGERFLALVPTIPWCTHHRVINYLARPLIKKFSSLAAATSLSLDPLTSSMRRQRLFFPRSCSLQNYQLLQKKEGNLANYASFGRNFRRKT